MQTEVFFFVILQGRDAYAIYRLFWKGNTNQIPIESAPAAAAEEGEQVHGGSIAPADATLQVQ